MPWGDDFAWILYCDYRFANAAQWFTRGTIDYFINYSGLPASHPFFRPLTASSFYLASLGHKWLGYKSQLAMNYVLLLLVFWTYFKFLRRFTSLSVGARRLVMACFLVSPVWAGAYFAATLRVHLLESACVLLATAVLPVPEESARLKRVILAACISAGAIFAHEVGVIGPLVVALTHYMSTQAASIRRKAGREAVIIVALASGLYLSVRLIFFRGPAANAYPLASKNILGIAFSAVSTGFRLFFPYDGAFTVTPALGMPILALTLIAYAFLAIKLKAGKSHPRRDLQMLTVCTLVAGTSVVLSPVARMMSIVIIFALPLLYMVFEPSTFRELRLPRLAQAGTALLVCAYSFYLALGFHSFLEMRAEAELTANYSRSMDRLLVSTMKEGNNRILLVNDLAGRWAARAMLELTAKEDGLTLVNPVVVDQLSVDKSERDFPVNTDRGVLVDCREDVISIRIELDEHRAFWFNNLDLRVPSIRLASGAYEFPSMRITRFHKFARGTIDQVDFGRKLQFTAPTECSQTAVVGFPGYGILEPRAFFLGAGGRVN